MSTSISVSKDTSFFSSFLHEVNFVQQVLTIPKVEPMFFPALDNPFLSYLNPTKVIIVTYHHLPMQATSIWSHITW